MDDSAGIGDFNRRRSTRVHLRVPLTIQSVDSQGRSFETRGETILVNKQGALLRSDRKLQLGSEVVVAIPQTQREQTGKVVWEDPDTGNYGVELSRPENLWGVSFPPDDWSESGGTPSADSAGEPACLSEREALVSHGPAPGGVSPGAVSAAAAPLGTGDNSQLQVQMDRRGEERTPATGEVIVRGTGTVIHGEVADVSRSGFRIRYRGEPVQLGPETDVSYLWGHVKASPVWFRSAGEWVEIGFKITERAVEEVTFSW